MGDAWGDFPYVSKTASESNPYRLPGPLGGLAAVALPDTLAAVAGRTWADPSRARVV